MTLSVIIPAYNDLPAVLRCINTLGKADNARVDLYVQDDASPAVNFVEALEMLPFANAERNAVNLGFAGNCNAGAQRAEGDILCFINQDVYATPEYSNGWATALLNAFADPQVGIVGARLLFPDGKVQSVGGHFDMLGNPYHRCLGYSNLNYDEICEPREVDWVTGACLAIRRDLFMSVGGFDTSYVRGYFEDTDLAMRVKALGYKVMYEPRCTLMHAVGSTGGNPTHFRANAMLFKSRWVDSGKVTRQANYVTTQRYW